VGSSSPGHFIAAVTKKKAGRALEPVWTFWGRAKPCAAAGKSNLRSSSPQPSQYIEHATSLHFTCSYFRRKYFKYFSSALMLGIRKDAMVYLTFCKVLHDTVWGRPGDCDKAVVHTIKKNALQKSAAFVPYLGNVHF